MSPKDKMGSGQLPPGWMYLANNNYDWTDDSSVPYAILLAPRVYLWIHGDKCNSPLC